MEYSHHRSTTLYTVLYCKERSTQCTTLAAAKQVRIVVATVATTVVAKALPMCTPRAWTAPSWPACWSLRSGACTCPEQGLCPRRKQRMLTCTHVRHRWNSNHQRHWAFSAAPGRFPPRAMFWSMRYATTSSIDTILEREGGFTLEELLEEDELLQECKSQNTKLLELCAAPALLSVSRTSTQHVTRLSRTCHSLCEPASLTKMITYIVTMPEESDTEARRYK